MRLIKLRTAVTITLTAILAASAFIAIEAHAATCVSTANGGTGTCTQPAYGQVLVGKPDGTYGPVATSTLNIVSNAAFTLTTSGSSGAATYSGSVLNIPIYSGGSSFSTTSAAFWLTTNTTSNLAEGANLYFTNARVDSEFVKDLAATSSVKSITTLPSLSLPYAQLTGTPTIPTLLSQLTNDSGFITGNQGITLSGDVSGSGSTAITTTIGANKVTVGDLAQAAANTVLGNSSGATGNVAAIATSSLFGTGTGGKILAWNNGVPQWVATSSIQNISLTTTGSSGAATLIGTTLNIPQYAGSGASSTLLGDTNTFSGTDKFNNPITVGSLTGLIGGNSGLLYAFASSSIFGYTPLNPTRNINTTFPLQGGGNLGSDLTLTYAGLGTTSPWTQGNLAYVVNGNTLASAATTTATCSGTVSCSPFTILGPSPITLTGSASGNVGNWFTATNNFGINTNGTSTALSLFGGVFASSTSRFESASTTMLSISGTPVATSTVVCKQSGQCAFTTIQGALNSGAQNIYVKNGVYSEQLVIQKAKTVITGESQDAIVQCNGATATCLDFNGFNQIVIRGLTLRELNAAVVGIGIDLSNSSNSLIDNVRISNFATSTYAHDTANDTFYNVIENSAFFASGACYDIGGTLANNNQFNNNRCQPLAYFNPSFGAFVVNAQVLSFIADDFEATTSGAVVDAYVDPTSRSIAFYNPYIEQAATSFNLSQGALNTTITGGQIISAPLGTIATTTTFFNFQNNGVTKTSIGAATSTDFAITNISGCNTTSALTTDVSGNVLCGAISGSGSSFSYPFPGNATTTNITFSSGLTGSLTGNASTATKWASAITINDVSVDGSGNVNIQAASSTLLGDTNTFSTIGTTTFDGSVSFGTTPYSGLSPLVEINDTTRAPNTTAPYLLIDGTTATAGISAIRLNTPNNNIDFVESDQTAPAGKYEIQGNGDALNINGRNSSNDAFVNFVQFLRPDETPTSLVTITATTSSATQNALRFANFFSSAGACPGLDWYTTTNNFDTARLCSSQGSGGAASSLVFQVANSSKALQERMRIDVNGNVGIGTTSPYATLSVVGASGIVAGKITATSTGNSLADLTIPGTSDGCATFTSGLLGSTGLACGSGGSTGIGDPFAHSSVWGQTTSATSTLLALTGSPYALVASSTSVFTNASTTQLTLGSKLFDSTGSAGTPGQVLGLLNGQPAWVATSTSGGGGGGAAFPFTALNNFGVNTSASTTAIWAQGTATTPSFFASSTAVFNELYGYEQPQATSTAINVGFASSTAQLVHLGTSATTITFSNYLVQPGMTLTLTTCNPNATAGALTFANGHYSGGVQPGNTTTANQCDMWFWQATQATSSLIFVLTGQTSGII